MEAMIKHKIVRLAGHQKRPGRITHVQMAGCVREVLCPERPSGEGAWVVQEGQEVTCTICARGLRLLQLVELAGPTGYTAARKGESKTLQHLAKHGHVRCSDQGKKMLWVRYAGE